MTDEQKKKNAARLSICSNAFLTVSKIVTGALTGSVSIISEGIHSGMDLLASFIASPFNPLSQASFINYLQNLL